MCTQLLQQIRLGALTGAVDAPATSMAKRMDGKRQVAHTRRAPQPQR
jgi:hypothetical protein